jgi:hypothetical protein
MAPGAYSGSSVERPLDHHHLGRSHPLCTYDPQPRAVQLVLTSFPVDLRRRRVPRLPFMEEYHILSARRKESMLSLTASMIPHSSSRIPEESAPRASGGVSTCTSTRQVKPLCRSRGYSTRVPGTITCRKRYTVPHQIHFYWLVFGK